MYKRFAPITILVLSLCSSFATAQTIIQTIPLPNIAYWNSTYGIAGDGNYLYVSSSTSSSSYNYGRIYKLNLNGQVIDSVNSTSMTFGESQGLAFDGTYFYFLKRYTAACTIIRSTQGGVIVDSMRFPSQQYLGDLTVDGGIVWVTRYSPNPGKLFKIDWTAKTVIDSFTTIGDQPTGIAWDGGYLYYAMDPFTGDPVPGRNLIYVVDPSNGDTVRTIPMPEPVTSDSDPRGLCWDGQYLWLVARRADSTSRKALYKYDLSGGGTPAINVPTKFYDHGRIRIGNTRQFTATIQSIGTGTLRIDSVKLLYSGQFSTNLAPPLTIPAGLASNFTITFTPEVYGVDSAHIVLYHNDITRPPQIIRNVAMGIQPTSYIAAPSSHAYGPRRVPSTTIWTLVIQNQGPFPFTVDSMSVRTTTFSIEQGLTPFVIDSLQSRSVRVTFHALAAGNYADTLRIYSNASNTNVFAIPLSGTGDPSIIPLGGIMWQGTVPDNPFTGFDDYQVKSIKEITDVNGDGMNDVIVASGNYLVSCFSGGASGEGQVLWTFNSGTNNNNTGSVDWEDALQVRDDVDGDDAQDVVFGCAGGNEFVYCVSGRTGQLIWAYGDSVNYAQGDINGIRVDRDYNLDGVADVLVSASGESNFSGRHAIICLNGLNGQVIFFTTIPYNFTRDIVSTEFGGAIGGSSNDGPYGVLGFDRQGQVQWTYPLTGSLNAVWSLKEVQNPGDSALVLCQYGFSGQVLALNAVTGTSPWSVSMGSSNNGKIVILSDLNGNGAADFAQSAPQVLERRDTRTGALLWSVPLGSSYLRGIDQLSDLNGDGVREIAVATQLPPRIVVLDGANGDILFNYSFGTSINQRGDRVAALTSIDANETTEFVGGNREGRVICFSGGPGGTVGVPWSNSTRPSEFQLYQNYPNPFNPLTTMRYSVAQPGRVMLRVYNTLGQQVATLVDEHLTPGVYAASWDAGTLPSGVYFYRLTAGALSSTKKMLLVK
jgi:hypothetical protein